MRASEFKQFMEVVEPAIVDLSKNGRQNNDEQMIFCAGYYFLSLTSRQLATLFKTASKYLPIEEINGRRGIKMDVYILWEV